MSVLVNKNTKVICQGFTGAQGSQGSALRQPLGVTIVGGLIASQLLTLLTTPVVYVLLDRLRRRRGDQAHLARGVGAVGAAGAT